MFNVNSSYKYRFKIAILNSTIECIDLDAHKRNQGFFTRINFYTSLIIFVLGIVGNLAAIYFISPSNFSLKAYFKRHYSHKLMSVNQYILRCFYIISLCSVLTILLNPVLRIYGNGTTNIKWFSYGWMVYQANFHFPISKTLTSTAIQISVLLFVNQIIAIKYPFKYKTLFTIYKVRLGILALLTYCLVWYIHTDRWYYVVRVSSCPLNGNFGTHFYIYKLRVPASRREYMVWTTYEIARELIVVILPFATMVCIKIWVFHRRRKVGPERNSHIPLSVVPNRNCHQLVQPRLILNMPSTGSSSLISSFQNLFSKQTKVEKMDISRNMMQRESGPPNLIDTHRRHVLGKRKLEEKLHKRTLFILTMEFVLLLIPLAIFDMASFYLEKIYDNSNLNDIYISLTLLEYIYIGGTFYINLAFNPYYREIVFHQVKKDYLKFRHTLE